MDPQRTTRRFQNWCPENTMRRTCPMTGLLLCRTPIQNVIPAPEPESMQRVRQPPRFGLAQPPSGFTSSVTSFVSDQVRNDVFIKVLGYRKAPPILSRISQ